MLIPKKLNVTVGIIIVILQLFLFVNADWIFGIYATTVKNTLLVYLMLEALILSTLDVALPTIELSIDKFAWFAIFFSLTSIVLILIPTHIMGTLASFEAVKIAIGYGILYGFVKAFIEEVIFRRILPKVVGLGDLISNILFGLFHISMLTMYGFTGVQLVLAFALLTMLGLIWAKVRDIGGIMGSTGSHLAYNLAVLGSLPAVLGVMA